MEAEGSAKALAARQVLARANSASILRQCMEWAHRFMGRIHDL
jgi:hypothetical protein